MENDQENPSPLKAILKGILYSNLFAVVAFAIAYTITNWQRSIGGTLSTAEFILVPIGMGIIAMKQWQHYKRRVAPLVPLASANTIIAIALSAFFMGEGIICLVIVSPLILGFMCVGLIIGKYIFTGHRENLKASTLVIYIGLFLADAFADHNHSNMVSDELVINAPSHTIWKYVAEHPVNTSKRDYWLFNIGLPYPIQSTVSGHSVGSERKCIFSNGATFDEVIVESKQDSVFTFDIIRQPEDPEIIGHINIERGQFVLKPNPNGTTTLVGNSWYTLKVYPAWYYDLWATDITRNVHIRAMNHIKALAEHDIQTGR